MSYNPKKCAYCGKIFIPKSGKQKYCKDTHYGNCPVCGKQVIVTDLNHGARACSKKCIQIERENTSVKKYGTKNPKQNSTVKEKSKQTCLDRYGAETPFGSKKVQEKINTTNLERYGTIHPSSTEEIKNKCQKTFQERFGGNSPMSSKEVCGKIHNTVKEQYGVDNVFQNETIKEKIKHTNLEKYGVKNPQQNKIIKDKTKQTNIEKYGVENPSQNIEIQQRIKNSMLERYGVEYALQNEEIKEKTYQTNIEKYGTKHPAQNKDIQQKAVQTSLEKYGTRYPMQSDVIKQKLKNTNLERYGVSHTWKLEEVKQRISQTNQEKYGVPWACMREDARNYKTISKINLGFADLLNTHNIKYEMEFPLTKYSYDFKVDNILIEINPTITHNSYMSIFDKNSDGLDKNYHYNKTKTAIDNNYKCINVFDWDDWNKIIDILKPKEVIYARNCILKTVSLKESNEFLNKYHLQNTCKGQEVRLGLYYNKKLIQIMTFGKPRYNKNYQWELLRLCSDSKYIIVGGAEKLFKHFIDNINLPSIISYCDISKFSGNVYKRLNMELINTTSPNKIWSKGAEKITNNFLLQRGYDQLFGTSYGKGTSNEELMLNSGWLPVYDCGQIVFQYMN